MANSFFSPCSCNAIGSVCHTDVSLILRSKSVPVQLRLRVHAHTHTAKRQSVHDQRILTSTTLRALSVHKTFADHHVSLSVVFSLDESILVALMSRYITQLLLAYRLESICYTRDNLHSPFQLL